MDDRRYPGRAVAGVKTTYFRLMDTIAWLAENGELYPGGALPAGHQSGAARRSDESRDRLYYSRRTSAIGGRRFAVPAGAIDRDVKPDGDLAQL
jgi:hypothetical protein